MTLLVNPDIWVALTLIGEADGEPYDGKVAVAEVIRNRARRHYNSDGTYIGTVLAPLQFSCWNAYSDRIPAAKADDVRPDVQECLRAWQDALAGSNKALGAVLYFNPQEAAPAWVAKATFLIEIGRHRFYGDP